MVNLKKCGQNSKLQKSREQQISGGTNNSSRLSETRSQWSLSGPGRVISVMGPAQLDLAPRATEDRTGQRERERVDIVSV